MHLGLLAYFCSCQFFHYFAKPTTFFGIQKSMTDIILVRDKQCECYAVLNGMDLVKKIEGEGSGSGKPKKQVTIAKSGELPKKSWV